MANTIKFKRASGSDPSASDLAIGEPGLRTDTAELFFKKDDGTVAKVSGGGGGPNFKYLELRNAANNGAASFPGNDFTLVTSGTTNAITPAAANTLLVSVSGVIQKPNAGTSTSGITGFIVDGSRFKTATNLPAAPDFILYQESGGIGEPSDNTVTSAKIVDGAIVNADINASAAIDVSKLSGVMPLAGGTFTGDVSFDGATAGRDIIFDRSDNALEFADNAKATFGSAANGDMQILHDGTDSFIENSTGNLHIRSKTGEEAIKLIPDSAVQIYHDNAIAIHTQSWGNQLYGTLQALGDIEPFLASADTTKAIRFKNNTGEALKIIHQSSNSFITNHVGSLFIEAKNGEKGIAIIPDAAVELYHDDSKKAETVSGGFTITGTCTATSFAGDGSNLTGITAGAQGGGGESIFFESENEMNNSYTISTNHNALIAGPLTIASGATLTINSPSVVTIP